MKNTLRTFLLVLFGCFFITACAFTEPLPCPISQESMANPDPDFVAYTIQNNACVTFCNINIAPSRCDDWGFDWIHNDALRTGESITAYLPAGKYDVLLEDCTDLSYTFERQKGNGENALIVSEADAKKDDTCQASLTVVNNTDVPICHMWIAAEYSERYGGNWLGNNDQIAPGESSQFFVFPGDYKIKAEDCEFNILRRELDTKIGDHRTWIVE